LRPLGLKRTVVYGFNIFKTSSQSLHSARVEMVTVTRRPADYLPGVCFVKVLTRRFCELRGTSRQNSCFTCLWALSIAVTARSDYLDKDLNPITLRHGRLACVHVPELRRRSSILESTAHAGQSTGLISTVSLSSELSNAMVVHNVALGKYLNLNTLRLGRPACAHVPQLRCRSGVH